MSWQRIVDKTPSYADKVRFWQTVIEVKRVSPEATNIEVMAALFEAEGQVQRAITILSSEEHAWRLKKALKGQKVPAYLLPVQKPPPRARRALARRRRSRPGDDKHRAKDIFPLIESIFIGEDAKPTTSKLKKMKRPAVSTTNKKKAKGPTDRFHDDNNHLHSNTSSPPSTPGKEKEGSDDDDVKNY
eukprot:CAMPEP_0206393892 /NCGR_PEP_ID=MMETSP0294-20121207/21016_1 /ASSEMBLY_ACC=CAM_ASM_000327 /TAXON_ID=39354 /ORGANISM="Heterosigma akashiwo, Strain CCMP2393" /LENGTH=186 /DNA_ID=CAMNT_0053847631 /DNA_START=102 /DNA_END=662 /DNA_ORIENTATION=-